MAEFTTGQIIEGIRKRDNIILNYLYENLYPKIKSYALTHGGGIEDAKDVFQETVIVIYKQFEKEQPEIKVNFEAYMYGIARMIWLKILRSKEIHNRNVSRMDEEESIQLPDDEMVETDLRMRLVRKYIKKLGKDCQKLLSFIMEGLDYKVIMSKMSYKSEKIVRNQKYKCKETLTKKIKKDVEYKRFKDEMI